MEPLQEPPEPHRRRRSAIFVGCNKGMDALNALRMLSNDETYDKTVWRQTMSQELMTTTTHDSSPNSSSSSSATATMVQPGHCGQEFGDQFVVRSTTHPQQQPTRTNDALVHCIEAMPITARLLNATAHAMNIQNALVVTNVAMSNVDGSVYFPDQTETAGIEQQGMANCQNYKNTTNKQAEHQPPVSQKKKNNNTDIIINSNSVCKEIPMLSLDTFIQQHYGADKDSRIDFVSIDVEGFDRNVMLGASQSLQRIGYLEFEYNWRGDWNKPEATLSSTVSWLYEHHGFVCYWAGTHGNVWRITDCIQSHYDVRQWSNVACVNTRDAESNSLWNRMEELFQATLAHGTTLSYATDKSIATNGRQQQSKKHHHL